MEKFTELEKFLHEVLHGRDGRDKFQVWVGPLRMVPKLPLSAKM